MHYKYSHLPRADHQSSQALARTLQNTKGHVSTICNAAWHQVDRRIFFSGSQVRHFGELWSTPQQVCTVARQSFNSSPYALCTNHRCTITITPAVCVVTACHGAAVSAQSIDYAVQCSVCSTVSRLGFVLVATVMDETKCNDRSVSAVARLDAAGWDGARVGHRDAAHAARHA